jgi:MOSC domain-containing protein YiiM
MSRPWQTSFFREPDPSPRWLYKTHLEGNEQADKKNHGSLDQAVLLYSNGHYPLWREELGRPEIGPGGFAENFTVEGIDEAGTYVGDTYAIGEARLQVSGPRYPCWKNDRRWDIDGLNERLGATGRTGWYCRVLQEGRIEPGMPIVLVERPYPQWSIALVNELIHGQKTDVDLARKLADCHLINSFWPEIVVQLVEKNLAAQIKGGL